MRTFTLDEIGVSTCSSKAAAVIELAATKASNMAKARADFDSRWIFVFCTELLRRTFSAMIKLRLVIAGSNESNLAGLKHMLSVSEIDLVGVATYLGSAIALLQTSLPDAVVIADEIPQGKDFVARSIRSLFPSIRVIEVSALTETVSMKVPAHDDDQIYRDALDKLIAGSSSRSS